MTGEPLIQGREYDLKTLQKNVIWPGRKIVYVRKEVLPNIGGEWETFYSIFGGQKISGSEPAIIEGILQRLRMGPEDVYVIRNRVFCRNIFTSLIIDDVHSPIVQSWLDEVERIRQARELAYV